MKTKWSLFLFAVLSIGAARGARGESLSYTATIGASDSPFTGQFTLPEFDPGLGTLNDIRIRVDSEITAAVDVFNTTGVSQAIANASASIFMTVSGPDATSSMATGTATVLSGTVGPNSVKSFPGSPQSASSTVFVPSANFGDYEGVGSSSATFTSSSASGTFSGSARPGVFFSGEGSAEGSVTITYDFTPAIVPEPSSLGMASTAILLGFWAARSRRGRAAGSGRDRASR